MLARVALSSFMHAAVQRLQNEAAARNKEKGGKGGRGGKGGEYVGHYVYKLRIEGDGFRIAERRAVLDAEELGGLGAVSFIL